MQREFKISVTLIDYILYSTPIVKCDHCMLRDECKKIVSTCARHYRPKDKNSNFCLDQIHIHVVLVSTLHI